MNPDKERLLKLAEKEDGCNIQVGGMMTPEKMVEIKISHQWFTVPKGTIIISPNGKPAVLNEDAIVFNQGTVSAKETS